MTESLKTGVAIMRDKKIITYIEEQLKIQGFPENIINQMLKTIEYDYISKQKVRDAINKIGKIWEREFVMNELKQELGL